MNNKILGQSEKMNATFITSIRYMIAVIEKTKSAKYIKIKK
ncbi:hypothetical protein [Bacillus pumilus]